VCVCVCIVSLRIYLDYTDSMSVQYKLHSLDGHL